MQKYYTILFLFNSCYSFGQITAVQDDKNYTPPSSYPDALHYYPNITSSPESATNVTDSYDVQILPTPRQQSEVHLSICKNKPSLLLASFHTEFDLGIKNGIQGYALSNDGGTTWSGSEGLPNDAPNRGDPATAFDQNGNGYIVSMGPTSLKPTGGSRPPANNYLVQKTTNYGATWLPQVVGVPMPVLGFDKPMVLCDENPESPYKNNFYAGWYRSSSVTPQVMFNRSIDGGQTFSNPIVLKNNIGFLGNNAIQVGRNGEVYVAWADYSITNNLPAKSLGFAVSTNGGVSFTDRPGFLYRGIRTSSVGIQEFNNTRVADFPTLGVDVGCGTYGGRIYVAYPEFESTSSLKSVIRLRYSDNQGISWSPAQRISLVSGQQSWFPAISVDETTGIVTVVYYCMDATVGYTTNTYVAYSIDGGGTFQNIKVSDKSHVPATIPGFGSGYAGDYISIASYAGKAYAVWADNRDIDGNGTADNWQIYLSTLNFDRPVKISSWQNISIKGKENYSNTATSVLYQSNGNIKIPVYSTFSSKNNTRLTTRAKTSVELLPGFEAEYGTVFATNLFSKNFDSCLPLFAPNSPSRTFKEGDRVQEEALFETKINCFPNPTDADVTLKYSLAHNSDIKIELFNINGYLIRTVEKLTNLDSGEYQISINIGLLPAGTYIYRYTTDHAIKIGKLVKI